MTSALERLSFAWTATSGYVHYPPYVNLTGNRLKVRGSEVVSRLTKLYDTLKAKLTKPAAAEALADLEKAPENADAQAALRLQLKKVLADDADLRHALEPLVREIQDKGGAGLAQTANVSGNENDVNQISGSGNTVTGRGGPR